MRFYYENTLGDKGYFQEKELVKAIYTVWNIDADLYIWKDSDKFWQIIFSPLDGNELNSDLLEAYGYKMMDGETEREIIEIKTGKVIRYDWSEVKPLIN